MRIHYKDGYVGPTTTMGIDSIKISTVPPYDIIIYDNIAVYEDIESRAGSVNTASIDSITFYKINFTTSDLFGEWINEQQDTLDFIPSWFSFSDISCEVDYKPLSGKSSRYSFIIEGDSILAISACSPVEPGDECDLDKYRKYYFRYSKFRCSENEIEIHDYSKFRCSEDEIEIRDFKGIEKNIFRRVEGIDISVTDFDIPVGCGWDYTKMQRGSVYLINSAEEWANIFTCESNPQIDFSTKTLLVAWGTATSNVVDISKKLTFANNTYTLTLDISLGMAAVMTDWYIVLITDKINTESVVLNLNQYLGNDTEKILLTK
jgi:hypothetical protein